MTVTIIVAPVASSPGRFSAKLPNGDILVTSSRTPFLDAARRLLEIGFSPETVVVMRHAGSQADSLRAAIGDAAQLTVKEKMAGNAPRFARWEPYQPSPVSPPIALNDSREASEPPAQNQHASGDAACTGKTSTESRDSD